MTKVFISFSKKDKAVRNKISKTLMREGLTIWTNKTDIKAGTEFQDEINKGIEGADNFIYLMSSDSLASKYCQQELERAFANNKRIIPLAIEDIGTQQIPSQLRGLQFINLTGHDDKEKYRIGTDKILKELKKDAAYYDSHKILLVKTLKWLRQERNSSLLLRGYNLRYFEAWLKVGQQRQDHPPLPIQSEFIATSIRQPTDSSLEVFISYSRADSDLARQLNDALQELGKTTWFDQESIASGEDFKQEIHRGIESSDNFLFIISPSSVNSPYCADEVEYALSLNKRFVTVLHSNVLSEELHPALARVQWINFNRHGGDFYANFSELIRTLDTDRDHVKSHTKCSQRALEWEQRDKSNDLLLRGSEFSFAQKWLLEAEQQNKQPVPTPLHKEFIEESKKAIEAAQEAEKRRQAEMLRLQKERAQAAEARLAEQKKSARRQKFFLAAVSTGLVVFTVLGVFYRQAVLSEFKTLLAFTESPFTPTQKKDALVASLKAGQQLLKPFKLFINKPEHRAQVITALYRLNNEVKPSLSLKGHNSKVSRVSFSPDGEIIVSASGDGTIILWRRDGTLLKNLKANTDDKAHSDSIVSVIFSPDGQTFASASSDKTIKLWRRDGTLLETLVGHIGRIHSISFSPDGEIIASASEDKTIKLWKRDGTVLDTLYGHRDQVNHVSFSPDGQRIVSASFDKTIKLWKRDGTLLTTLKGHKGLITSVSFSPDGEIIASASSDTIKLWKRDGTLFKKLEGHRAKIYQVRFSPDGEIIASASRDKTIKLWKRNGTIIATLDGDEGHSDAVYRVSFSPDGKIIASGSEDKTIKLWTRKGKLLDTFEEHIDGVIGISFSPDNKTLASASYDNTVILWKVEHLDEDNSSIKILNHDDDKVSGVRFGPDGQIISTSLRTIQLWKQDGTRLDILEVYNREKDPNAHTRGVEDLDVSPNGQLLATASQDRTIKLWKLDGTLVKTLWGHTERVSSVSFSPDGRLLASASADKTVKLWDLETRKEIRTLQGHDGLVNSVSFSPDGQLLASASADKTVKLWKREGKDQSYNYYKTLKGHKDQVLGVSFSPDSQLLASASADKTIKLWKREGKDQSYNDYKTLKGHEDQVLGVSFSPDGKLLASASADKTVKLWTLDGTWLWLMDLKTHHSNVSKVSFSSDGKKLASASDDKTAILWQLPDKLNDGHEQILDELLEHSCQLSHDYLNVKANIDLNNFIQQGLLEDADKYRNFYKLLKEDKEESKNILNFCRKIQKRIAR